MPLGFFFMLSRWFYNTYNQPFKTSNGSLRSKNERHGELLQNFLSEGILPRRTRLASVGESHDGKMKIERVAKGFTCEAFSSCLRTTLMATSWPVSLFWALYTVEKAPLPVSMKIYWTYSPILSRSLNRSRPGYRGSLLLASRSSATILAAASFSSPGCLT